MISSRMPRARSLLDGSRKEREEEGVQKIIYRIEEIIHLSHVFGDKQTMQPTYNIRKAARM